MLTRTLGGWFLRTIFLNDATCIADNWRLNSDFANIFCSFKFSNDKILKISEIFTKKRKYDFWKPIVLINDLMPDSGVFNFGPIVILYFTIVLWLSENFSFTKLRKNFYVSIISVMTHHNDVSTRRFRLWKGSSLIFFLWEYFFYVQLTIKQGWKIKKCPKRAS